MRSRIDSDGTNTRDLERPDVERAPIRPHMGDRGAAGPDLEIDVLDEDNLSPQGGPNVWTMPESEANIAEDAEEEAKMQQLRKEQAARAKEQQLMVLLMQRQLLEEQDAVRAVRGSRSSHSDDDELWDFIASVAPSKLEEKAEKPGQESNAPRDSPGERIPPKLQYVPSTWSSDGHDGPSIEAPPKRPSN